MTSRELQGPHLIAAAQRTAALLHAEQTDAHGAPYAGHIQRVVAQAESLRSKHARHLDPAQVQATAYLHDSLEDTPTTINELRTNGIPAPVLEALLLLTHTPNQPRAEYLQNVTTNPMAVIVKLADTIDNANPERLAAVATHDPDRAARLKKKYDTALSILQDALPHTQRTRKVRQQVLRHSAPDFATSTTQQRSTTPNTQWRPA